ncbi:hypothetical protein [Hyphobacterium vulgare]
MLFRIALIAASAAALAACSTVQRLPLVPGGNDEPETQIETVLGSRFIGDDILVVRVASNGCTQKGDFRVDVSRRDNAYSILLERVREDYCRALMPNGVEIAFGFEELGVPQGAAVTVANPVR